MRDFYRRWTREYLNKDDNGCYCQRQVSWRRIYSSTTANVSDGFLDLVILKNSGSFKMLEEFISMKNGEYTRDDKDIIYIKACIAGLPVTEL
jgi:hypothetical protein